MTAPDIAAALRALREAHEASTQGEWSVDEYDGYVDVACGPDVDIATNLGTTLGRENARAIALAHNLLPDLIAVVEAAVPALAELERQAGWSGAAGNWPLQEAVTKLDAALARLAERGT